MSLFYVIITYSLLGYEGVNTQRPFLYQQSRSISNDTCFRSHHFLARVLNLSQSATIALPVQYEIVVTDIERQTFQFIDFDQLLLNI